MQICLQSKVIRKIIFRVTMLTLCVVTAVCAVEFKNKDSLESITLNAQKSKYLATEISRLQSKKDVSQNNIVVENTKMNNEVVKNSSDDGWKVIVNKIDLNKENVQITVYNHNVGKNEKMLLEDYIIGCVCAEMPSCFDLQALMAQAVAVRTFSVRKMLYDDSNTHKNADVCTDYRHCQSYIAKDDYISLCSGETSMYEKIKQAVYGTKGVVAMYNGEPIMAVYHASSGVATKNCKDVWGGDIPYLVSVPAPEDKSVCAKKYEYSYSQISSRLSKVSDVAVQCYSPQQLSIGDTGLSKRINISDIVFEPNQIKKALGLRSEYFDVILNDDGVVIETYGYGHLVGMSQYGADALAKQGKSYIDILKYYYKDIELGYLN